MKEKMRKTAIIVCVICFAVFSSVLYPMEKVEAAPIAAVPAGITLGTGVYVGTALVTAGIAGLIGYDQYQQEINAHAGRVWQDGTQAATDSLNASINLAKNTGNGVVTLQGDFINFMEGKLTEISNASMQLKAKGDTTVNTAIVSGTTYRYATAQSFENSKYNTNWTAWASADAIDSSIKAYEILSDGTLGPAKTSLTINADMSKIHGTAPWGTFNITVSETKWKKVRAMIYSGMTVDAIASAITAATGRNVVVGPYNPDYYSGAVSRVREAWTSMRDAGLVLPVDSAVPYSNTGQPLNYNKEADTYAGIDGVPYTGQVDWQLPRVKWRDKSDTITVPGVYVDTPVLTGNPDYDKTRNPDIPNTTTNVFTGTTIANPDIATGNPAIPTTPPATVVPPFDAPGTTGLDFTPLMMTGTEMTNKFPFSIPFDFVTQLKVLDVKPEAPSFNINIPEFLKIGSFVVPFKMNLSFEMFDPIANIIRWGMIVIFDISLIFAIRKLLPE